MNVSMSDSHNLCKYSIPFLRLHLTGMGSMEIGVRDKGLGGHAATQDSKS